MTATLLIGVLGGALLTLLGIFAFSLIKWIRELAAVARKANAVMQKILDDPALASGFRSFKELSEIGIKIQKTMLQVDETIQAFYRMAISNPGTQAMPSVPPQAVPATPGAAVSDLYFPSEAKAATAEAHRELHTAGITLEEKVPTQQQAVGDQV